MQCMMLMETLFGADGLVQLKVNVVVCAGHFQLHLIRFVQHAVFGMQNLMQNIT